MELQTQNGRLKPGGAFKLLATGYFLGAAVIFLPLFALIAVIAAISIGAGGPALLNGEQVQGGAAIFVAILPLVMLPMILAMQALMIGGLAVLGLWLYNKWRPILVVEG